jgi:hypothetical protein
MCFFTYNTLNIISYYNKDKLRRDLFLMQNKIKHEESKVDNVLANLLPNFVRSRFSHSIIKTNNYIYKIYIYYFILFYF